MYNGCPLTTKIIGCKLMNRQSVQRGEDQGQLGMQTYFC